MLKSGDPTASYSTFEEFLQAGVCGSKHEAEAIWEYFGRESASSRKRPDQSRPGRRHDGVSPKSGYSLEDFKSELNDKGIKLSPEIVEGMYKKNFETTSKTVENPTNKGRWLNRLAQLAIRLSPYASAVLFIGAALILLLLLFPPTFLQYDKITAFRGFQFVFNLKDRIDGLVLMALCVAIGIATLLTYAGLNRLRQSAGQSDGSEKKADKTH